MNLSTNGRRAAQVFVLCGLLLALAIASGCGPKPAAPPPKTATATNAVKTNAVAAATTNLPDAFNTNSVFEDLPSPKGKDPFFPFSHRRDPKVEVAAATADATAHVEPVLVLKAIIRTSKHSQAVINNEVFEKGDYQSVRVPNGKIKVRCIEIGNDFVRIQADGESEQTLTIKSIDGEKKN